MKIAHIRGCARMVASAALLVSGAIAQVSGATDRPLPVANPCSILTSLETSATLGLRVQEGVILFRNGPVAGCSFTRAGGDRIALLTLRVAGAEWLAVQADRMHRASAPDRYVEIDSIGERAFLLGKQSARPVLCVFKNPYYLQISIPGMANGSESRAALERLARTALRRLTPGANQSPSRAATHPPGPKYSRNSTKSCNFTGGRVLQLPGA